MNEHLWVIQRRRDGFIFDWTIEWQKIDAWKRLEAMWPTRTRRKLLKEFKAVKAGLKLI